jgi:hypothetical protein
LGAKVAIIELNGFFGGVATAALVNIWHSTEDMKNQQQIIAGLTTEVFDRLSRRDALTVYKGKRTHYVLNTEELKTAIKQARRPERQPGSHWIQASRSPRST